MSLFPKGGDDPRSNGTISRMYDFYNAAIMINQSFFNEGLVDTRFYSGDASVFEALYAQYPTARRNRFNFNRIRRIINLVSGQQRRNRKSTIVIPVENGSSETADQFTKIFMWLASQEGVLETVSDAFEGSLITGMNLLQVWLDYREDPISGNIRVDNCSYNSFVIDPYFKKADLSDCNGLWKRSFLTKKEVISLCPDFEQEIIAMPVQDIRDGKFMNMPEGYNNNMKNLIMYDEFYYRDYRQVKMLVDGKTGATLEWNSDNEEALRQYLQMYPRVSVVKTTIPTTRLSIVVNGRVFYDGPNPLGIDKYPFVPVWAYYHPEMPEMSLRIQGMTRGLRDSQYLYTQRRITEMDLITSQATSGWIYKENTLVDPKAVHEQIGQGRAICVKHDANLADIQQIPPPQIPPSMFQLSELLAREIMEVSGVNEENLGAADDSKAGILAMLRQGAGLTTLQGLFDQLDRSQKLLGKLFIDIIQKNFVPAKVALILGKEPSPEFFNKAFGKYDAMVEDGINTSTQKQQQLAILLHLKELGIPVPNSTLIDATTVQNKKQLMDALDAEQQQAAQSQQMQEQMAMQEAQSRIQLAQARATADQGLGVERLSRVEENEAMAVERRAAAVRDEDAATLNLVKALKEIDTIDIQHLEKLVGMMGIIKQQEMASQQQENPSKVVSNKGAQ